MTAQSSQPAVDWEHPTPPTNLIFDDGEPLESNRHRIAMNVLIDSSLTALAIDLIPLSVAICLFTTARIRR